MSDEVILAGKTYVSSKKAAELTGYARDYIGQLARGGYIDAERVGGLWYVSMESISKYENNSETAKMIAVTSRESTPSVSESSIHFGGREYFSASRASKLSGYNQDYIGQLARGGKIPSRQIGNRWYVDYTALIKHKEEKDALLAAVQAESVGIQRKQESSSASFSDIPVAYNKDISLKYSYSVDHRDLIPVLSDSMPSDIHAEAAATTQSVDQNTEEKKKTNLSSAKLTRSPIQPDIRVAAISSGSTAVSKKRHILPLTRRNGRRRAVARTLAACTIILVASVGLYSVRDRQVLADADGIHRYTASAGHALELLGDSVERLVSEEITYTRQNK
jgi:hypothetical protein